MKAQDVIEGAYRRCNRLSPGETLSADDLEAGFDDLNIIVDELSARNQFLFETVTTSATQTGNITLGAGDWTAIAIGEGILAVYVNNIELDSATPEQFAQIYTPTLQGLPYLYSYDGKDTISLYPQPVAQTIKVLTGATVSEFADINDTDYSVPPGYKSYLIARLAIKRAPIIAKFSDSEIARLEGEERKAKHAIRSVQPAIINSGDYTSRERSLGESILNGG